LKYIIDKLINKTMKTNILGYPRIGSHRELKKACEAFWAGKITIDQLLEQGAAIRWQNWKLQKNAGIDLISSNDFSFYDHVLDMSFALGAIPKRYDRLLNDKINLYFAMARGYQKEDKDVIAMEMTKWFDTNYHYIVPEFTNDQTFRLFDTKVVDEFNEAKSKGIMTKPVLIGPITYLLLGKEKESGFYRLDLIDRLLPVYEKLLAALEQAGAEWVQIDEPFLALDLDDQSRKTYKEVYERLNKVSRLKLILTSYFEGLKDNIDLALSLPTAALHVDLVRDPEQLDNLLKSFPDDKILSLGVVDGRNIWKNDYGKSIELIRLACNRLGSDRVFIAGSSSFLHVPYDLDLEKNETILVPEIKQWMAFAKQKVSELINLKIISCEEPTVEARTFLKDNKEVLALKNTSSLIHNIKVKERVTEISDVDVKRKSPFQIRRKIQHQELGLPLFPTTTIGSFPQTKEVRLWRSQYKKGKITLGEYTDLLKTEIRKVIKWQEKIGLDVLVHGEFERNDMVEYFGEKLEGFTFSQNGWVQSYGSRCVKPPIIFGDVSRSHPITVEWTAYAQSLTKHYMKGMLTGPVTILQWSFVRNDQLRSDTCLQIALAIRDEVLDMEKAGIKIIQIDEPAIREGLPLRHEAWSHYLGWAVKAFCVTANGVKDETQIHTHMCYSEFNDIIKHIALMDADVITMECSRSQMDLLDAFVQFRYPNEIGPGVYDIHSPRVPSEEEISSLLKKAAKVIPAAQLWVNPDCGLKTRGWTETDASLKHMVAVAKLLRAEYRVQQA
jgi:5-methyltetrahydropteroyltriglutamate--homocysteine methyltransferase